MFIHISQASVMFYNIPINEQPFLIRFRGILTRLFSKVHYPTTFNKTCLHLNLYEIVFSQLSSRYLELCFYNIQDSGYMVSKLNQSWGVVKYDVDCLSILLPLKRRISIYFKSQLKPLCRTVIVYFMDLLQVGYILWNNTEF